jgi:hypothetical protein
LFAYLPQLKQVGKKKLAEGAWEQGGRGARDCSWVGKGGKRREARRTFFSISPVFLFPVSSFWLILLEAEWATSLNFGNASLRWDKDCSVLDIESLADLTLSVELWKVGKKKSNKIFYSVTLPLASMSVI